MIGGGHLWHFLQFWRSVTLFFSNCLPSFFHSVKIRLGVYQPNIKTKKEQVRNYSMVVPHPEFNAGSLNNDLVMIKLSKAAALNNQVGTIAIAMEPLPVNNSCFIPTWTWSKYKNRKCFLTLCSSSWEGFGAGEHVDGYTWRKQLLWGNALDPRGIAAGPYTTIILSFSIIKGCWNHHLIPEMNW